jgi:hypothetical protein
LVYWSNEFIPGTKAFVPLLMVFKRITVNKAAAAAETNIIIDLLEK